MSLPLAPPEQPLSAVFAGTPARKIKEVGPELREGEIERIANNYVTYASWFSAEGDERG